CRPDNLLYCRCRLKGLRFMKASRNQLHSIGQGHTWQTQQIDPGNISHLVKETLGLLAIEHVVEVEWWGLHSGNRAKNQGMFLHPPGHLALNLPSFDEGFDVVAHLGSQVIDTEHGFDMLAIA